MPLAGRIECGCGALVEGAHVVGPHAGGVHHDLGPHLELAGPAGLRRPAPPGAPGRRHRARGVGDQARHLGVVGHDGAVVERGRAGDGQGQAGVVGPGVVVEEPGHQPVGAQGGEVGQRLGLVDAPVALADAQPAGEVVEPQGGGVGAGHALVDHAVAPEEGDEEGQRRHQVGGVVEEALALVRGPRRPGRKSRCWR